LEARGAALARILVDSVGGGAAIGFMAPVSFDDALLFWSRDVAGEIDSNRRILFVAEKGGRVVGTVQVIVGMPANQPHRCEVAKMIVAPAARRQGIGRALISHAIGYAQQIGKTLITLDTRTGDAATPLYLSVGFEVAGIIPDYAWDPDGRARHATTYMFRRL
jgi:ribosomal protein S18 acetylase RimI-like enzyme